MIKGLIPLPIFFEHIGVVCSWSPERKRGWIATHSNAPVYVRDSNIRARGDVCLIEGMLVEFEVEAQKQGGIYASKITCPGNDPICMETGKVRKLIYQLNSKSVPRKEYHLGVVKMWKGKRGNHKSRHYNFF